MQLLMRRPEITNFVAVAPPVNMFDFSFLTPCPTGGLIVQGDNDSIVPVEEVDKLVDKLNTQRNVKIAYDRFKNIDHFFKGKEQNLSKSIEDYLDEIHDQELPI